MGAGHSFQVSRITEERVVIVTGANTGIGYEIAKWCAMMGATVIVACRSEQKAFKAIKRMNTEFEADLAKGTDGIVDKSPLKVEFTPLDLASFKSVRTFCEDFKKSGRKLHILICNAGIGYGPYQRSEDGLETVLQVNYLSHFIMAAKLLPIMNTSGPDCRIVLMSSEASRYCTFDLANMNYRGSSEKYPRWDRYGKTKLYQIMQVFAMSRRLVGSNVTINCVHPGLVETEFFKEAESSCLCLVRLLKCFGISKKPIVGAGCVIDLAMNKKYQGETGKYWYMYKELPCVEVAKDKNKQELLWRETLTFVQEHLSEEELKSIDEK